MTSKLARLTLILTFLWGTGVQAASVKITGAIKSAAGYSIYLLALDGSSKVGQLGTNGKFVLSRISKKQLKGASLQLVDASGRYVGPVVFFGNGARVATTFSGKLPSGQTLIALGKLTLKSGFAKLNPQIYRAASSVYGKRNVLAKRGKPLGAGEQGLVQVVGSSKPVAVTASGSVGGADPNVGEALLPGSDTDLDGLPNSFDADDDGDLNLDASDPDAAGSDVPYASLYLDFRNTINANVRAGLSESAINAVIGGANMFSLATFISLSERQASVTGGHIVCAVGLVYCQPNSPTAYYGGVSESSSEFRDHAWSELLTSAGYPRLELISLNDGFKAIVAAIQPRVGPAQFRPGDVYQAVLTDASAREVESRTFTLAPYFVSVPAIQSYDAGSGPVTVNYGSVSPESGSIPGTSNGDPIQLSSAGLLTVNFWRPQRPALRSDETGYYDWGHVNYGIVIESAQATCAGYYSNVSGDLVEDTQALGTDSSPFFNRGANGMPYRDAQDDRAADPANLLSFTVNLKSCIQRAGLSTTGTYRVALSSAGESVTGGRSSANQSIYVQVQ